MYDYRSAPPKPKRLPTTFLLPNDAFSDESLVSERINTPDILSQPQSRQTSPLFSSSALPQTGGQFVPIQSGENTGPIEDDAWEEWVNQDNEDEASNMPSDLRPSLDALDALDTGRSHHQPLLSSRDGQPNAYNSPPRPTLSRKSTFHERDPIAEAKYATKKRYSYAAFFLVLSLISFAVQTETAVYIQSQLHWEKAYCMLYVSPMFSSTCQALHLLDAILTFLTATSHTAPGPSSGPSNFSSSASRTGALPGQSFGTGMSSSSHKPRAWCSIELCALHLVNSKNRHGRTCSVR